MTASSKQILIHKQSATCPVTSGTIQGLTQGQIGVFSPAGTVLTGTPGTSDFVVAAGPITGAQPRVSNVIAKGSAVYLNKKVYAAGTNQVFVAGYQGTGSLNINFVTDGTYELKVMNMTTNTPPFPTSTAVVPTFNLAGQNPVMVADLVAAASNSQLLINPDLNGGQYAFVDVLSDITSVQLVDATSPTPVNITGTVTNGSTILTLSASAVGGTTAIAAGDWIRIGSATAKTSPVYQIASVSTTTVTLTRPFVGTSASAVALGAVLSANYPTTASLAGLKVTITGDYFPGTNWYETIPNKMGFVACAQDLTGTPVSITTNYSAGSGSVAQVSKIENEALGYLGAENRIWFPYPNDVYAAQNVGSAAGYIVYTIGYNTQFGDKSAQGLYRVEPEELYLAVVTGTSVGTLETLLASVTGLSVVSV
jgi:hypothetical protein